MKTIKQIKSHLATVTYNRDSRHRIIGFLLGNGTIQKGQVIEFSNGPESDDLLNFDDFYAWFNEDRKPEEQLLDFLIDEQVKAIATGNWRQIEKIAPIADFVIKHFGFEKKKDINKNKNVK